MENDPIDDVEKDKRRQAVGWVVAANMAEVEKKYGVNSDNPKSYHGSRHTRDVFRSAVELADYYVMQGLISFKDYDLIQIASSGHDTSHGEGSGIDEMKSADIAIGHMVDAGIFDTDEMTLVANMIIGTTVHASRKGQLIQEARYGSLADKIVADADLSWVGGTIDDEFWQMAQRYLQEKKPQEVYSGREMINFIVTEIEFLSKHAFLTGGANELFPYKHDNIRYLKRMLGQYK